MEEIWKEIENYPDYEISSFGNVKSKERYVNHFAGGKRLKKEKILITATSNCGYEFVGLCVFVNGKCKVKTSTIHRLVGIHFIENPFKKPQVNHIDGNKLNNKVENLEWNTSKENVNHAVKNKLRVAPKGSKCGASKLKEDQVLLIRASNLKLSELAEIYKISFQTISEIKLRKTWKHL